MIVEIEHTDRGRVIMSRREFTEPGGPQLIRFQVEANYEGIVVRLTAREARKIAVELLWLAEKIEEEESGS